MVHHDDDDEQSDTSEECAVCGDEAVTAAAVGPGPLCQACAEAGVEVLTDGGEDEVTSENPLDGYEAETTEDYRSADADKHGGDGEYRLDHRKGSLTESIADIVTRQGGRIPTDFGADVQNEGYARERSWRVYAPSDNPYHVAAAVNDLLLDSDGVDEVNVHVNTETGADIEGKLRMTRFNYAFEEDQKELMEKRLRHSRWESGIEERDRPDTEESEAHKIVREQIEAEESEDSMTIFDVNKIKGQLRALYQHPGDAWDHCEIRIQIHEEADVKEWA